MLSVEKKEGDLPVADGWAAKTHHQRALVETEWGDNPVHMTKKSSIKLALAIWNAAGCGDHVSDWSSARSLSAAWSLRGAP